MVQAPQFASTERRKSFALFALGGVAVAMVFVGAIRWIAPLNDFLVKPQYSRGLTLLMMQELSKAVGETSPVILLGEDDRCDAVAKSREITDDQTAGFVYTLTYSEGSSRFTCITANAVPTDPAFPHARILQPGEGEMYGKGRLLQPVPIIPVGRSMHVYSPEYLRMLNWRTTPRFPLSQEQARNMTVRHYDSGTSQTDRSPETASIDLDFNKARALVAAPHIQFNLILDVCLACIVCMLLATITFSAGVYKRTSQSVKHYGGTLSIADFLQEDLGAMIAATRSRFIERQQEAVAHQRERELSEALSEQLQNELQSSLTRISDPEMQKKIRECLSAEPPTMDRMKTLVEEARELLGRKTPAERLALLLESLKPYCSEEEFIECRREAYEAMERFGFKEARTMVVAHHDRFRLRAREMEKQTSTALNSLPDDSPKDN